jgi:hypothetical protein
MIIYYNNKTGKIQGVIMGRVHNEFELQPNLIQVSNVVPEDISRRVLDVAQTKEVEKYLRDNEIRVLDCDIVLDDPNNIFLRKRPKEETPKSDSVETIEIDLNKNLDDITSEFSATTKRYLKDTTDMTFMEIPFSKISMVRDVIEELENMKDIVIAKQILTNRSAFLDGHRKAYIVVDKDNNPLAVAVITSVGKRFKYTLGGVTQRGRDTHAGDFLVYSLIKDAKELGFKIYDLGGIYADWADENKKKVNAFKERWGGKKVSTLEKGSN